MYMSAMLEEAVFSVQLSYAVTVLSEILGSGFMVLVWNISNWLFLEC